MIKSTISLVIISMFLWSCSNSVSENQDNTSENATQEEHQHDDEPITLNNGKKWKVDEDMLTHIRNMENDINSFEVKGANDYATLASKVDKNLELLTSNCTMKGQAHDELHKWLLPFIELSEEFSASKTEQESADDYQKIKASFITFNTYFE